MLRGGNVERIHEPKEAGLSVSEIARQTGYDRKTIRKYLQTSEPPRYGPRKPQARREGTPRYA